jgi:mono/diheme cytochrome c family protein
MRITTVGRAIVVLSFLSVTSMQVTGGSNQQGQSEEEEAPSGNVAVNYVFPMPPSQTLSPAELAGKKVFMQRCQTCHIPSTPVAEISAPYLDGKTLAAIGDAAVRKHIWEGDSQTPAFQYTLTQGDVDNILVYLKTLSYDPVARKYTYVKK